MGHHKAITRITAVNGIASDRTRLAFRSLGLEPRGVIRDLHMHSATEFSSVRFRLHCLARMSKLDRKPYCTLQDFMAETAVDQANASKTVTTAGATDVTVTTLRISPITAEMTEALRHLVLWPDKPLDYVRLDEDKYGHHFGAFVPRRDTPAAVISVFFEPIPSGSGSIGNSQDQDAASSDHCGAEVRFRKFACHQEFQGLGIGTALLRYTAAYCANMGATVLWCDARLSTSMWYEKRGLVRFGDTFFKSNVEYTRMKIMLANNKAEEQRRSHGGKTP